MAELRFFYGTMGSGKSTLALQIHHNLVAAGHSGLLLTRLDRTDATVSSRLGVAQAAVEAGPGVDIAQLVRPSAPPGVEAPASVAFVVCDEAQFYDVAQIEQLAAIVDDRHVDVYAFGLLTDFRGRLFPASARLLELADQRTELRVEARCWCNRPATHNARLVDGRQVYEGETVVVGDLGERAAVTYELRCRRHWTNGQRR